MLAIVGAMWQTGKTGRDGGDRPITRGPAPRAARDGYTPFVAQHGFAAAYDAGLARGLGDRLGQTLVVTQPEAWAIVEPRFGRAPTALVFARALDQETLDALAHAAPDGVTVVGIGGGTAMDVAKWISWRRNLPLVQLPTLASVDACFTRMSALRDGERVRYDGDAVPDEVLIDYEILGSAPLALLSAGIGDVLSCLTALADWKLAVAKGIDPAWNQEGADASVRYIDALEAAAPEIAARSEAGIRALMELHREIGWRCHDLGHARFEEGSEHFFAYCFEAVTGRTIMHGELVVMGVLAMTALTEIDHDRARRIVTAAGTRWRLSDLGVTWPEVEATLRALPEFARAGGYWYSHAHERAIGEAELATVRRALGA
jgi:glycerol dehydrogenase-like iron-containing ADH family enzyme